jgi:hypothetical protein
LGVALLFSKPLLALRTKLIGGVEYDHAHA